MTETLLPTSTIRRAGIEVCFPAVAGYPADTRFYEWTAMHSLAADIRRWWSRADNSAVHEALDRSQPVTVVPARAAQGARAPRHTKAVKRRLQREEEARVQRIMETLGL